MTANNVGRDWIDFHYEDGFCVMHNPGSGQLCNPGGLSGYIEALERNSDSAKHAARAARAQAARDQKAEDIRVLGPLYAELAAVIRRNVAAAKKAAAAATPKKRVIRRRRRNIKDD